MDVAAICGAAMQAAISEARTASGKGEMPYGAVITAPDGRIIARAHDQVCTLNDPTRHGEFDAVRMAINNHGPDLKGCYLVSTVEPCCMCSGAAWYAGISTAVFGLTMHELKSHAPQALEEAFGPVAQLYSGMERKMTAIPGVLRTECLALWTTLASK